MQQLPEGISLQGGKYRLISVLGQGGFGITYLAEQTLLGTKVAIKEFFMKEHCERDASTNRVMFGTFGSHENVQRYREKFLKEARNIARLKHPNIVKVMDVFEENGTAYYVMEYAEGGSLALKVQREGYLSESVATKYVLQVADALGFVHNHRMMHLDVKPANIMLDGGGNAILIDFGLSKQYDASSGRQTSTTPVGISEGYAPMEQYMDDGVGEFSPTTDIYSLGATFYFLLTGVRPPSASHVNEYGLPKEKLLAKGISKPIVDTICKAMQSRRPDRMQSIDAFVKSTNGATRIENLRENVANTHNVELDPTLIKSVSHVRQLEAQEGGIRSKKDAPLSKGNIANEICTNIDSIKYALDSKIGMRTIIEELERNKNYREAYNRCLEYTHKGVDKEWIQQKMYVLIPKLKNQSRKKELFNIIMAIILTISIIIVLFFIQLL